jgi:myosin-5
VWTSGEHTSNGATLQLLEGRIGLLALLNEQCRLPRGDDATFVAAVRSTHASHPSLRAPKLPQTVFVVAHYAGQVAYSSGTFVAKSRDARPEDLVSLLAHSACAFTRALLLTDAEVAANGAPICGGTGGGGGGGTGSSSLGLQFKAQLGVLLETIGRGASHYVRCLTPNHAKLAGVFEPLTVLHQLRCSGLIDAVRVARQGHPSRLTHHAFLERYHCLAPHAAIAASSAAEAAEAIGAQDASPERVRRRAGALIDALRASASLGASWAEAAAALGRTKVFLQTAPYRALEARRAATLCSAALDLQRMCRGRAGRRRLALALAAVRCIQRTGRGTIGRATLHALRRERASSLLQSAALGWLERRRRAAALMASSAASRIVAVWRCHRAQRTFHVKRLAAVALQCAARCRTARGALKGRRKQARDLAAAAQKAAQDVAALRAENATLRAALSRADDAAARATIAAAAAATAEPEEKEKVKVEALAKAEAKAVTDSSELCQLRSALQEQQVELAKLRAKLSEQEASSSRPPLMPPASPKATVPSAPTQDKENSSSAPTQDKENSSSAPTQDKENSSSAPTQDKENSSPSARSLGLVLSPALATASASAAPPPQGTRTVEGSLARALAAEAEVSRLKAQLRMLQREVDGRGSDKVVALKTALNGQVRQLEADVASERRHAELAAAKVAAEARAEQAEECVRRQERITAKLLKELRETKTALGAQQCTASMLLRLRGDLLAAIEGAVTRLGTVKASLDSALAPAADRFASAVLTDAHQAEEHVAAVEEAAAAAWANAEAAEERTQRAERLLETLEQRVVAQAGLVAALLRRASDRSDRSPDALSTRRMGKRAGDADAKVDGAEVEDAEEKALEPMSPSPVGVLDHTLITSPFAAAARRLSAAFTPAAISMVRVSSVTRSLKGVIGVSFGACDENDGRTGRAGGGECGGSGGRYVAMLEDELRCTLDHLEAQREVSPGPVAC